MPAGRHLSLFNAPDRTLLVSNLCYPCLAEKVSVCMRNGCFQREDNEVVETLGLVVLCVKRWQKDDWNVPSLHNMKMISATAFGP